MIQYECSPVWPEIPVLYCFQTDFLVILMNETLDRIHGRKTNSVVPIIYVYITGKFDNLDCTKIPKTLGAIWVSYFRF